MNTEVMNPNKVTFITVVAILKHITGTLAEPCTFFDGHGEHWVVRVGGGEVFFYCDKFHNVFSSLCVLCVMCWGRSFDYSVQLAIKLPKPNLFTVGRISHL